MKYKIHIIGGALMLSCLSGYAQEITDTTVVNVAYGVQSSKTQSAAISTVKGERLMEITSPTVGNSLKGMLPGLSILQKSGEPGYDFYMENMFTRGVSSFNSKQQMLVFVDGFEAPLDNISVEEIESVSLLKDAAALAIYGSRGANGVLLITTKKGYHSSPKIGFRMQTGIQMPTIMDTPMDAYNYARLYNQALENDGKAALYTNEALAAYQSGSNQYLYPNVNWKNQLYKNTTPLTMSELSFRGGGGGLNYYVMAGLMHNDGIYRGTDSKQRENANVNYARYNFRANLDVDITKYFRTFLYSGVSFAEKTTPGAGGADDYLKSVWTTPPNAFPVYNPNGSFGGTSLYTNPVANLLNRGLYKENSRSLQVIFGLQYDFSALVRGLSAKVMFGYHNFMAESSPKTRDYARYSLVQTGVDAQNNPVYSYTQYGSDAALTATEGFRTSQSRIGLQGQIDYQRQFGDHGIHAMLLMHNDRYQVYDVRDDECYVNFAGRLSYDYQKRYIAEVVASYMGTDNYARGRRFGVFPAMSAAWVVSSESFMKSMSWVDFLKLRTSYGLTGNNQTSARYMYDESYGGSGSYLFGTGSSQSSGFTEKTLANPFVTWEKKRMFNVGIDATLWKNLSVNFDVFHEVQSDILAYPYAQVLGIVGASYGGILPLMNVGKVTNHGFELKARYQGKVRDNFSYFAEAGTWYAMSRVDEQGEDVKPESYLYKKGNSVWKPIVLEADGYYTANDFDSNGKLNANLPQPRFGRVAPGDIKYKDYNNDQVVDENDAHPIGNSTVPAWNYMFSGGFKYKGFDFSVMFQGIAQRDIYLRGASIYSFQNNGTASNLALDSWTPTHTDASYPRLSTMNFSNNYRTSTFWRRNGSFLRLRNVQVGYELANSVTRALRLSSVYFYVNATNLFTLDHLGKLGDAEQDNLLSYPLMRTVSVGLKLAF